MREHVGTPISLIVVDPEEISRKGLVALIRSNPGLRIAGEASDVTEAIENSRSCQPDGIIFRTHSLQEDGVEILAQLRREIPSARIMVLASSGDGKDIIGAVKAGAKGFLTTGMDTGSLMAAVRAVARGEVAFSRAAVLHIIDYLSLPEDPLPLETRKFKAHAKPTLTAREVEVLCLVSQGASNRGIAESLVISEHTARAHLRNILDKLRLDNRIQAATWAVRVGLGGGDHAAQPGSTPTRTRSNAETADGTSIARATAASGRTRARSAGP